MTAVIQRVSQARVRVDDAVTGEIQSGLLIFLGIAKGDTPKDASYLADKIIRLRIFPDGQGKMNLSLLDAGAALLVVSQFTLLADCRKGRRPSFDNAASPDDARHLYDYFVGQAAAFGAPVATGVFQAHMDVELVNDGPVTFVVYSSSNC